MQRKPKTSSKEMTNSKVGEGESFANAVNKLSLQDNSSSYSPGSGTGCASPHKITKFNKLRRYEEGKNSDAKELERAFSPINNKKTFGVRMAASNRPQNTSFSSNFTRTMTSNFKDEIIDDMSPTNSMKFERQSVQKQKESAQK